MLYSTTATLLSCLLLHAAFVSAQGKVTSPPRREVGPAYRSCSTGQCDFGPCQGLLFEDNKNNVQRFLAGQQQTLVVDAQASSPGLSKVSVVDIATNAVISDVLDQYTTPNAKSKTGRTITIPNLSPRCSTAGECVLLHVCLQIAQHLIILMHDRPGKLGTGKRNIKNHALISQSLPIKLIRSSKLLLRLRFQLVHLQVYKVQVCSQLYHPFCPAM